MWSIWLKEVQKSFTSNCSPVMASGCLRASRTLLSSRQHRSMKNRSKHSWRPKVNTPSSTMMLLTVKGMEIHNMYFHFTLPFHGFNKSRKCKTRRTVFLRQSFHTRSPVCFKVTDQWVIVIFTEDCKVPADDWCSVDSQWLISGSESPRVRFWFWSNPITQILLYTRSVCCTGSRNIYR